MQQEAVRADPTDFNKWVSLLSASEKLVSAPFLLARQLYLQALGLVRVFNTFFWCGLHLLQVALLMTWMQGISPNDCV